MIPPEEQANYETFRECLSDQVISRLTVPVKANKKQKKRGKGRKNGLNKDTESAQDVELETDKGTELSCKAKGDAEELADFIEVRALYTAGCAIVDDAFTHAENKHAVPRL
jgi:hypothetical protein